MAQNDSQPMTPALYSPSLYSDPTSPAEFISRPRSQTLPASIHKEPEPYNHLPDIFLPLQNSLDNPTSPRWFREKLDEIPEDDEDPDGIPLSLVYPSKTISSLNIVRLLSHVITYLLSLIIFTIISVILYSFKSNFPEAETDSGFSLMLRDPETWPLFLLLLTSGISIAISVTGILGIRYFFERKKRTMRFVLGGYGACALGWLAVVMVLKGEIGMTDSWGWSCGRVERGVPSDGVNLTKMCSLQNWVWILSTLEIVANIGFAIAYYTISKRSHTGRGMYRGIGGGVFTWRSGIAPPILQGVGHLSWLFPNAQSYDQARSVTGRALRSEGALKSLTGKLTREIPTFWSMDV